MKLNLTRCGTASVKFHFKNAALKANLDFFFNVRSVKIEKSKPLERHHEVMATAKKFFHNISAAFHRIFVNETSLKFLRGTETLPRVQGQALYLEVILSSRPKSVFCKIGNSPTKMSQRIK